MASIILEATVRAPADAVWRALSEFGAAHRVFSGVLSDCYMDGDTSRVVTFASGLVVRERLIDIDQARRRIAYTVTSGGFEHHGASMRIVPDGDDACRFIWRCDVLPDGAADRIRPLMESGTVALMRSFEV